MYRIASTVPEEMRPEVQAGFETWNLATGYDLFVYGGLKELSPDQLAPDYTVGENVVLATERTATLPAGMETGATGTSPLAMTYIHGGTSMRDSDIYLFDFTKNYMTDGAVGNDKYSVKAIVAHEAGHMLFGGGHSSDPTSIMTSVLYPMGSAQEKDGPAPIDVTRFFGTFKNGE